MASLKQKNESQPLRSILKQPRSIVIEDTHINDLQREVKFWKSRFDELSTKRQKQIQIREQDEQKEIALFQQLESQIYSDEQLKLSQELSQKQNSTQGGNSNSKQKDLPRLSLGDLNENSLDQLTAHSETELGNQTEEFCNLKRFTSLQEPKSSRVEVSEQVSQLTNERDQWKQKYEESVHPRNLQKMQEQILQDFLQKAQSGIQEAAEQLEAEKRAQIYEKEKEAQKLQQKIIDYATMVSEKDSLILQKELSIAELEHDLHEKDTKLAGYQEDQKRQKEMIAKQEKEIEVLAKQQQDYLDENQRQKDFIAKLELDIQNLKQQNQDQMDENKNLKEQLQNEFTSKAELQRTNEKQAQQITELQLRQESLKEQCQELKEKIVKLKSEKEEQEELTEQLEDDRSKLCSLQSENEQLKMDQTSLSNKVKNYEKMIQQKGVEVQAMVFNLQEEMLNYAREVGLLQQAEQKQIERIKELEAQLMREKQLTLILQDSILNKSLVLQQQKQQTKTNENEKPIKLSDKYALKSNNDRLLFKDTINLQQNGRSKLDENAKEVQSAQYLSIISDNQ